MRLARPFADRRHAPPRSRAQRLDARAYALRHGDGALELAQGDTLLRLMDGDRLLQLGFSRASDYARERLGVSWRTASAWLQLARGVAARPLLRKAVRAGLVSPRKARVILPVAVGEAEWAWTCAASTLTEARLRAAVAEGDGALPDGLASCGPADFESLLVKLTEAERGRVEAGLAVAEIVVGPGLPPWRHWQALAWEWLGGHGVLVPDDDRLAPPAARWEPPEIPAGSLDPDELVARELAALTEAACEPADESAAGLDRRARRLRRAQLEADLAFGVVLLEVVEDEAWRALGWRSLVGYARERLGLAERTLRERVWMERRMNALPPLREALAAGRLTWTQACAVARRATVLDVDARIDRAAGTTAQQGQRESDAEEEMQNRTSGVTRLWGPDDAMDALRLAIAGVKRQAARGGHAIGDGEALARLADHFVGTWTPLLRKMRTDRKRRAVVRRHGGRCAVPGCSRPAAEVHHVVFRSRGGGDEPDNLVPLCRPHHRAGVHAGRLEVVGRAGERLEWRFADGARWVTVGDDDVRREVG